MISIIISSLNRHRSSLEESRIDRQQASANIILLLRVPNFQSEDLE